MVTEPPAATASEPLRRFLQAARGAGLQVSAAEGIDAARALELVGVGDRTLLKHTLGLVIAKTPAEKALYDETFELYFTRDALDGLREDAKGEPGPAGEREVAPGVAPQIGATSTGPALGRLLETDDRAALTSAMETAARAAGVENIRYFTQKNITARRILERMGLRELELEIDALRASGSPEDAALASRQERRLERLRDSVRDLVERSLLLYARGETEQMREEILRSTRLANVDRRHLERMRALVRRMARKLATRYAKARRRRDRGQLDARRTTRRNMGWGGIPFLTIWKRKRIEKPRIMVLCDVSGSVAAMSEFLLTFLYALTEALADIRSFAYSGSLVEVSEILENESVERAIERIMRWIGYGSSSYGNAFADFEAGWMRFVTSKTTLIILGDARGNRTDPRTDIFARLAERSRRIIWLNPEPRSSWGTGDSDMPRYAPYCDLVRVCSTLRHLERVVADILRG